MTFYSEYDEWCFDGDEYINELAQQLQSYLNYKKATIRLRFTPSSLDLPKKVVDPLILKQENKIMEHFSNLLNLMNNIDGIQVEEKIDFLINKSIAQKNGTYSKIFNQISIITVGFWKVLCILSNLDVNDYPALLKLAIDTAGLLCIISSKYHVLLSDFYKELKLNYIQLEEELLELIKTIDKTPIKKINRERRMLTE